MSSSSTRRAVAWMVAALASFCLLAIASRELTLSMGTLEILFWRSLLGLFIIVVFLGRNRALSRVVLQPRLMGWHLLRNSAHFCGQCAWLIAIAALPLAEVFALEFTTPLWAALLAALFMGEPLHRGRWMALLLGLIGVLIILRPGAAVINPASLVMLAGAFGFAVSVIVTRRLTQLLHGNRHVFLVVLFYMTLMQGLFALIPIAAELRLPSPEVYLWLPVAAITALAAHYCLSRALSYADAAVVMPIDYLRLPMIMLAAWWVYDEAISIWLVVGAGLIVAGNALGLYLESVKLRRQRAALA